MEAAGYQLKSELARVCLPAPGRTVPRRLAWANSISLLFLLIGVLGEQSRLPALKPVPPLEQPVPVIVEPLPPPPAAPTTETKETDQQNEDDKPQAPQIQQVTIDTPAINFAVPTEGQLLVAASVAPTPMEVHLRKAAPVKQEPRKIESSGNGGDRPAPAYPRIAAEMQQQGTVTLLVTVNDAGKVESAEIKESSGHVVLDHNAQEWVKRHWTIPPGSGGHLFLAPIRYQLK